jgi:hypothetical protein
MGEVSETGIELVAPGSGVSRRSVTEAPAAAC